MASLLKKSQEICRLYQISPARSKGQNFLIDSQVYDDIIDEADIDQQDVLEVGPGLGFLSTQLAVKARQVVAVELDDQLADILQTAVLAGNLKNLKIVNQDILNFNPVDHFQPDRTYQIVANLPYNISSLFLRNFLSNKFPPKSLLLMLQKEVAERIIAQVPKMNLLALSVQHYGQAEIIKNVPAKSFWPQPQVDSALIRIEYNLSRLESGIVPDKQMSEDRAFFRLAKIGFSAKRKMLKNNLAAGLGMDLSKISDILIKAGLSEKCRAENLSIADWSRLLKIF